MPPKALHREFICPRCNYHTPKKSNMMSHFARIQECPPTLNNLKLTPEITSVVLKDRIYQNIIPSSSTTPIDLTNIPPIKQVSNDLINPQQHPSIDQITVDGVTTSSINQSSTGMISVQQINQPIYNIQNNITNNNNIRKCKLIQNIVINIDTIDKLKHILDYRDNKLIDLSESIESLFEKELCLLRTNNIKFGNGLATKELLECVNKITRIDDTMLNFNVHYDKRGKRIKIYDDGCWTAYLEDSGIDKVIEHLLFSYLNDYELYLLRKIHDPFCNFKAAMDEKLQIYYKFLCCFEFRPHVIGFTDKYIIGRNIKEDKLEWIANYASKVYSDEKKKLKTGEMKNTRKLILNIIKTNSVVNIDDVNEALIELLKVDTDYRDNLLSRLYNFNSDQVSNKLITSNS